MAQAEGICQRNGSGFSWLREQDGYLDCYAVALSGVGACASRCRRWGRIRSAGRGRSPLSVRCTHWRELGVVVVGSFLVDELLGVEVQVVVVFETCLLPPLVERARR